MSGDKTVVEPSDAENKDKSKANVASEDNRFVLPAGGGTDQPDVGDNNVGGGADANAAVAVDGRTAADEIILPGSIVDGANGNASVAAGDSFTVAGDDFEFKIK